MSKYLYETHMHTAEVSACASVTGAEQARIYKVLGYEGVIVTDHFYHGNTLVRRNQDWKSWVKEFVRGYENTKKEGDKIGLSVFFGWEESFQGNDFLIYGLDEEWLLDRPEIIKWDVEEYHRQIKAAGGFFVHAHPFREADYIAKIRLFPNDSDAVEVINSSHSKLKFDKRASKYASNNKMPITAGSDSHNYGDIRGGMIFNHRLEDIEDFIASVKAGSNIELIRDLKEYKEGYL